LSFFWWLVWCYKDLLKADDRLLSFFALANTLCFCCMLLKHTFISLCLSSTFLPILETSTGPTPILLVISRTTSVSWLIRCETSVLVDSGTSCKITLSLRLSLFLYSSITWEAKVSLDSSVAQKKMWKRFYWLRGWMSSCWRQFLICSFTLVTRSVTCVCIVSILLFTFTLLGLSK